MNLRRARRALVTVCGIVAPLGLAAVAIASPNPPLMTQALSDPGLNSDSQPLLTQVTLGRWMEENAVLVGPQNNGVSPPEGNGMLRLSRSGGLSSQVRYQVDVSHLASQIADGNIQVIASGLVNASSPGVIGGIMITTIAEDGSRQMTFSQPQSLDGNLASWELRTLQLVLPPDTVEVAFDFEFDNITLNNGTVAYADQAFMTFAPVIDP